MPSLSAQRWRTFALERKRASAILPRSDLGVPASSTERGRKVKRGTAFASLPGFDIPTITVRERRQRAGLIGTRDGCRQSPLQPEDCAPQAVRFLSGPATSRRCPVGRARQMLRLPNSCGYHERASPTKCARSTGGECLASSKARGRPVACRAPVRNFARTAVHAASISTASMCDTPQARHSKTYWI